MKVCFLLSVLCFVASYASPQFPFFRGSRPQFSFFNGGRSRPRPQAPQFTSFRGGAVGGGGSGGCGGGHEPNYKFGGKDYLLSWRIGCSKFGANDGASFCRANNMKPISLDSAAKEREFLSLVARENQKYFWTGGKVSGRSISWPSGQSHNDVAWSHTGGSRRPQPDNREGNEFCVAILNNFYRDGVKFHDVACHHRKPIICEA